MIMVVTMNDDEDEDVNGLFVKRTLTFIMIMTLVMMMTMVMMTSLSTEPLDLE